MTGMEKGNRHRRMYGKRALEGLRYELRKNSLCIRFGVKGLGILVSGIAFFACIFSFLLLEFPGVQEQNFCKFGRGFCTINRSLKPLLNQSRQVADVVQMRMGEDHRFQVI